jgi:hypothetical protein
MPGAISISHLGFFSKYAYFQFKERFTDLASSLGYLGLYPFYIWVWSILWFKFNSTQGNYTRHEILVYLCITELLFFTFLRSSFIQRSNGDFSIGLARPRSWLALTFFGQIGSTLGGRIIYTAISLVALSLMQVEKGLFINAFARLFLLLPLLCILESLMATLLASCQLIWAETRYFVLPICKIFLALGGVLCPLADYGEPGRSIFLMLPASDLFFQVGHFCLRGEFYQMTAAEWVVRILFWTGLFYILNLVFFRYAQKKHQSFGG